MRKRCGFGCVICGLPIYDYDHLTPWSEVNEHKEDNLTLLCDKHHREKTSHFLPDEEVRKANSNPYNKLSGHSEPLKLHYKGAKFKVRMGKTLFGVDQLKSQDLMVPLIIDGYPMIAFSFVEDHLLLNLYLYDHYNQPVLIIEQNELVIMVGIWDIQFVANRLIIKLASRNVLMVIRFDPPSEIWIERGVFLLNGVRFTVTESDFKFADTVLSIGEVQARIGIVLGTSVGHPKMTTTYGAAFLQEEINRYCDSN